MITKRTYQFGLMLFLLGLTLPLLGQHFLKTEGQRIINEKGEPIILKGMGLGGWMLQEGYMMETEAFANSQHKIRKRIEDLIGSTNTNIFYNAWLKNHVQKADIDALKSWGFNSVRVPMHYNLFTLAVEDEIRSGEQTWLEKGFQLTDSLIAWCKQNEMYVILDLHAAPGGQGKDEGISDYDPDKASLWEEEANRTKTIALWKKLAERYKEEPWVAGYDLLNEPNWNLQDNVPLRKLYMDITAAIRSVGDQHILFIEGNWFANDFNGLTPPWDDNLVYSPHKYWSTNDDQSIQWALDIRAQHNVPLYFGEWGENSNSWFTDVVRLFDKHQIGWAAWPMKKIESVSGLLSIAKTPAYQTLLNYWGNGGDKPDADFAKSALMALTEAAKFENCVFQKDIIDAMFRQAQSSTAIPFKTQKIPGVVQASDYDMGPNGVAYFDTDIADYRVSTGNFTAWNSGWTYRNDGVDIEKTAELVNSNGYNVGWLSTGEWMQYDVDVAESGTYSINVRIASNQLGGAFHFRIGESAISIPTFVPHTEGWQNWQTTTVSNVVLTPADKKIRFYVDASGFNVSNFEFIKVGPSTLIPTDFVEARTLSEQLIQVSLNKRLNANGAFINSDFEILVNGQVVSIQNIVLNEDNPRMIQLALNHKLSAEDVVTISYNGSQIKAEDGTDLNAFVNKPVQNKITLLHIIPGRVEAEDFGFQSGIQLENTFDDGGGKNIAFLDIGDYLDYKIKVLEAGTYQVSFRTAALLNEGKVELQLIDENGSINSLQTLNFAPTGDWQKWETSTGTVVLPAGELKLRLLIKEALFNINWFEFSFLTNTNELTFSKEVKIFPNPSNGHVNIQGNLKKQQAINLTITNLLGQVLWTKKIGKVAVIQEDINLSTVEDGVYYLILSGEEGAVFTKKIMKLSSQN